MRKVHHGYICTRSSTLRFVLLVLCLFIALHAGLAGAQDAPAEPPPARGDWWDFGFGDYVLNENVLLYLGHAWSQSADASEVLETASRVDESDPDSWTREFRKTAERLMAVGRASEKKRHAISASHAYLRAATYFRAALHRNFHPNSAETAELAAREAWCFERYLALSESPCASVRIPYERTTLPGYFCRSPKARRRAPVIIFNTGRDVWAEDAKLVADEAMARGYHALLFDGPGQGQALRRQGLRFRPDWDKVITPVVDFAIAQRGVDESRLVLWGESMGGYLVPRAAAYEHRLRAIVANPGVTDWFRVTTSQVDMLFPGLLDLLGKDDAELDRRVRAAMAENSFARWGFEDYMWKHGVESPSQLFHELDKYRLGDAVKQIRTTTLVVDAEADDRGQARELFEQLEAPKDFLLFTAAEAAQFHDQPGAKAIAAARIYDWIDDVLASPRR